MKCITCGGEGRIEDDCEDCDGSGADCLECGRGTCEYCDGDGRREYDCEDCAGSGEVADPLTDAARED